MVSTPESSEMVMGTLSDEDDDDDVEHVDYVVHNEDEEDDLYDDRPVTHVYNNTRVKRKLFQEEPSALNEMSMLGLMDTD